jgi:hypothetical protein
MANKIEVADELVEVLESWSLEDFPALKTNSTVRSSWENQGVTNVHRVRLGDGDETIVLEYGPGYYEFQRRYSLRGDQRAGRKSQSGDNLL